MSLITYESRDESLIIQILHQVSQILIHAKLLWRQEDDFVLVHPLRTVLKELDVLSCPVRVRLQMEHLNA